MGTPIRRFEPGTVLLLSNPPIGTRKNTLDARRAAVAANLHWLLRREAA